MMNLDIFLFPLMFLCKFHLISCLNEDILYAETKLLLLEPKPVTATSLLCQDSSRRELEEFLLAGSHLHRTSWLPV